MLFNIFLSVLDIQTLCRVRHAYTVQVVHSAVLRQVVYLHAFDASGSVECLLSSLQSLCGSVQVICGSVSLGSDSLSGIDGFLQSLARISVGSRLTQQVVSGSNLLVESLLGNSLVVSLLGSLQCLSGSIQLDTALAAVIASFRALPGSASVADSPSRSVAAAISLSRASLATAFG